MQKQVAQRISLCRPSVHRVLLARDLGNKVLNGVLADARVTIVDPELLKGISGYWSRRINEKDRLVYKIGDSEIMIAQCRTHYGDH